ncbi:hypothetical protein GCM10028799_14320 [Kribbella italica]
MLITHGCSLDKCTRSGVAKLERAHFLPLQSLHSTTGDRQRLLKDKQKEIEPVEGLYLGEVPRFGEAFVAMSDPFSVPADYFALEVIQVVEPSGKPGWRIVPGQNDTRFGRIKQVCLDHFHRKWIGYWTRLAIDEKQSDA